MKMFILGHFSMTFLIIAVLFYFYLMSEIPKGYRLTTIMAMLIPGGIKRGGKRVQYRLDYWIVNGENVYTFYGMIQLLNSGYTQDYRNLSIKYDDWNRVHRIRTARTEYSDNDLSEDLFRYSEKRWLKRVWNTYGKQENTYPKFAQYLNNIDDEQGE